MQNDSDKYYQSPKANLQIKENDYDPNTQTWYHASGRIGRLRFWAYQMAMFFIIMLIIGLLGGVVGALGGFAGEEPDIPFIVLIVGGLLYLVAFAYSVFIYPIRRLHDLDQSGWMCLINLVPLANLMFILYLTFAKGDAASNKHGKPPRPNKWYHWLFSIFPVLSIGILAAIAIPAYQDYVQKSHQAQAQNFEQLQQKLQQESNQEME